MKTKKMFEVISVCYQMSQCEGEKNDEIQNSFQTCYIFFAKDWVVDELYFIREKARKVLRDIVLKELT